MIYQWTNSTQKNSWLHGLFYRQIQYGASMLVYCPLWHLRIWCDELVLFQHYLLIFWLFRLLFCDQMSKIFVSFILSESLFIRSHSETDDSSLSPSQISVLKFSYKTQRHVNSLMTCSPAEQTVSHKSTDAIPPSPTMWVAMAEWRCTCFRSLIPQAEENQH